MNLIMSYVKLEYPQRHFKHSSSSIERRIQKSIKKLRFPKRIKKTESSQCLLNALIHVKKAL